MKRVKSRRCWWRRLALVPLLPAVMLLFFVGWILYVLAEKAIEQQEQTENE